MKGEERGGEGRGEGRVEGRGGEGRILVELSFVYVLSHLHTHITFHVKRAHTSNVGKLVLSPKTVASLSGKSTFRIIAPSVCQSSVCQSSVCSSVSVVSVYGQCLIHSLWCAPCPMLCIRSEEGEVDLCFGLIIQSGSYIYVQ